jgi:hypothetical protein
MWMEVVAVWWMWVGRMFTFLAAVAVGTADVMFIIIAIVVMPVGVRLMAAAGMVAAVTVNSTKPEK